MDKRKQKKLEIAQKCLHSFALSMFRAGEFELSSEALRFIRKFEYPHGREISVDEFLAYTKDMLIKHGRHKEAINWYWFALGGPRKRK